VSDPVVTMKANRNDFLVSLGVALCGLVAGPIVFAVGALSSDWGMAVTGAAIAAFSIATLARPLVAIWRNAREAQR